MSRLPAWVKVVALATLAFLYVPLAVMAIYSVNDTRRGFAWEGFTLRWYGQVFADPDIRHITANTLVLALASTAIATPLGTLLALGLDRFPWPAWFRHPAELLVHLPVVTPDIVLAASLAVAFGLLQEGWPLFESGMLRMVLGHVTFQVPFVALVVRARLATLGRGGDEAARDLYADTPQVLRRLTLPLLGPGILAGAMLAFTLSLDDFVVSFFTAGADSTTLPIHIYAELRKGITATTHALSTAIFLVTVVLVIGLERLTHWTRS